VAIRISDHDKKKFFIILSMEGDPSRSWGEDEVNSIREANIVLYQSEIGQKMLRMLRHFQGGDQTGPHTNSSIWILEILQNAIDAGAKTIQIYYIPKQGILITHDNYHRIDKGMTLNEMNALCNISTTTKTLTSIGFFGIGFKSIFKIFQQVLLSVVSAPGGHICLNIGKNIPLTRLDILKSILPIWINGPLVIPSTIPLLDTSFFFTGCRVDENTVASSLSTFLSPSSPSSSLLRYVLQSHGLENLEYYFVNPISMIPTLVSSSSPSSPPLPSPLSPSPLSPSPLSPSPLSPSPLSPSPLPLDVFISSVSWSPSDRAYQTLQQLRDLNILTDSNHLLTPYTATVTSLIKLPLIKNSSHDALVFCTFPTHDLTGLHFSIDGPFLLDANRLHLRWESDYQEWNLEIITHCLPNLLCQLATWLPTYLNTILDPFMFHEELHQGLEMILSWTTSWDTSHHRTSSDGHKDTLMTIFQTFPMKISQLHDHLLQIPFLPLPISHTNSRDLNSWISPQEVVWPISSSLQSSFSVERSSDHLWFTSLPNAYLLCPSLPTLNPSVMKLVCSLFSTPLRHNPNYFMNIELVDMKRWYFSFSDSQRAERKNALLQIWKQWILFPDSTLPCVPTLHHSGHSSAAATAAAATAAAATAADNKEKISFKSFHETFYFVSKTISYNWQTLIQRCLHASTFEYDELSHEYSDLMEEFLDKYLKSSPPPSPPPPSLSLTLLRDRLKKANTSSLPFINQLLQSISDDHLRFSLALEFIFLYQQQQQYHPTQIHSFWTIVTYPFKGCSLIELSHTLNSSFLIITLPDLWLPTQELHQKYHALVTSEMMSDVVTSDVVTSDVVMSEKMKMKEKTKTKTKQMVISLDIRLFDILEEKKYSLLRTHLLRGGILKNLLEPKVTHTKDELTALEFAESRHPKDRGPGPGPSGLSSSRCLTGWGSKRGYLLTDWVFTSFGSSLLQDSDLIPHLIALLFRGLSINELKQTFYRSANTEKNPTGARPCQWIKDIAPLLPIWICSSSLREMAETLINVCSKEENLMNWSLIQQTPSSSSSSSSSPPSSPPSFRQRQHLPSIDELHRRDKIMRFLFSHRNWISNAEYQLKRSFVQFSSTLLPDYPLLIDDEWEVIANRTDLGRGDLLFCTNDGSHIAVVELKANTSSTAESVREQARKYASAYYELYEVKGVRAYIARTTSSSLIELQSSPQPEMVCEIGMSLLSGRSEGSQSSFSVTIAARVA
jgi:hypothetical protein